MSGLFNVLTFNFYEFVPPMKFTCLRGVATTGSG